MYKDKKIMPDYTQGKIYTVRCKTDETLIYVGCTTQSLVDKNKYLVYFYNHICGLPIFYTWCIDNWYIELFENIIGASFVKADITQIQERIEKNVLHYLENR